nr:uncharacterized protein LOC127328755 [Lolium perenne]
MRWPRCGDDKGADEDGDMALVMDKLARGSSVVTGGGILVIPGGAKTRTGCGARRRSWGRRRRGLGRSLLATRGGWRRRSGGGFGVAFRPPGGVAGRGEKEGRWSFMRRGSAEGGRWGEWEGEVAGVGRESVVEVEEGPDGWGPPTGEGERERARGPAVLGRFGHLECNVEWSMVNHVPLEKPASEVQGLGILI